MVSGCDANLGGLTCYQEPVRLRVNLLRKSHFGQISRSNSLNRPTIRLIRSKNLTQNDIPSLRFPKSDRLLASLARYQIRFLCGYCLTRLLLSTNDIMFRAVREMSNVFDAIIFANNQNIVFTITTRTWCAQWQCQHWFH
jgi:hypothetical protein